VRYLLYIMPPPDRLIKNFVCNLAKIPNDLSVQVKMNPLVWVRGDNLC
jgi:hypothetical protein